MDLSNVSLYFRPFENLDCESPTYIEAREVESKYDWVGSSNKLAYPVNSSDTNTTWAWGISTATGYEPRWASVMLVTESLCW